jgi:hypothetical protein
MRRAPPTAIRRWLPILVTSLLLAPVVGAEDHHESDSESEWEYEIDVRASGASIAMRSAVGDNERSISFEYNRDEASVEFEIESEVGSTESEASMEVQFHQLLEYTDSDGNGRYDAGEPVVSAFQLGNSGEEKIAHEARRATWGVVTSAPHTSDNGVAGTRFSSTASVGTGTLRLDFYVYDSQATLGPASIEPTELKLDIIIRNYPYASNSSALALLLDVESASEIEDDGDVDSDEEGVAARVPGGQLLFAWKDFATVDGTDRPVRTTVLERQTSQEPGEFEHEELFVFSYARGTDIIHDPTLGVQPTTSKSHGAPGPSVLLLGLAIIALAAVVRRQAR